MRLHFNWQSPLQVIALLPMLLVATQSIGNISQRLLGLNHPVLYSGRIVVWVHPLYAKYYNNPSVPRLIIFSYYSHFSKITQYVL